MTPESVLRDVRDALDALAAEDPQLRYEVEFPMRPERRAMREVMPAMSVPTDHPLVQTLRANVRALVGVEPRVGAIIPQGSIFLAVLVYALGMVVFTMIMGNAFAAFPVMAAAIGVPILIHADGGNPAVIGAVGMLSGFCGTLMTPMAANFNMVPAALLELKDQYGVIRVQVPTALVLLAANVLILYVAGFHL